jgi:DNA polymerase (family 10)
MDSRTAAHVLRRIAAYLELNGENRFKTRAYLGAAKGLLGVGADDLKPLYESGELASVRGLGPATLAVVRDLVETGESRYLEQLRESMPEGLLEMLDLPALSPAKIRLIHQELGIETVEELEAAARDGRLAKLPKFGPKTAEKILRGIATARDHGSMRLYYHVVVDARQLLATVRAHRGVTRAEIAGEIRRRVEIVSEIEIVAACDGDPVDVAQSWTRVPGVRRAEGTGASVSIGFVDGTHLRLHCVRPAQFGAALWLATGSTDHVRGVVERLAARGVTATGEGFSEAGGRSLALAEEAAVYDAAGMSFVEPELREGLGEVEAATRAALPSLVQATDIRGALHCHSTYSDGKASIAEMARAARDRGWSYIGITDHSQSAFYAGGLSRERVLAQLDEIDELNEASDGFRILKGIEADILADGRLDYPDEILDRFDFVVGSIHSRLSMDRSAMTERLLRALDDPHLTILAHPTGRLLLSRPPYDVDLDALFEKARAVGAAIELNADPHRLDLDWRHLRRAKSMGIAIEIGPDAHSTAGLGYMEIGVGIARKAWLERRDVVNAWPVEDVLSFARARRSR